MLKIKTAAQNIQGGPGNDSYVINDPNVAVFESPGQGNDTIYTTVSYTLAAGSSIETLTPYDRSGTAGLVLTGNELGQTIFGNNGDNALIGGGGADIMYGLGGSDSYIVDSADDIVTEFAGQGNDTVYTSVSYALAAGSSVETLTAYDRSATVGLVLTGNELGQTIFGNNGDNALIGGGGADTMYGLGGNDSYIVDSADDVVTEFAGQGNDTVYTTVSYTLTPGSSVETLTPYDRSGTTGLVLTGNELGQTIFGNNGDNALIGGGGADTMYGFGGNDSYIVDSADDVVMEFAGQGNDTVYTTVSYTLTPGSSVETLTPYDRSDTTGLVLTGNELSQTIFGNNGDNALIGGGGADTMYGFGGNDSYIVDSADDVVTEFAGQGNDTVYATVNYALAAGSSVEVLTPYDRTGTAPLVFFGNELGQTLYGNAGANLLDGKGGNDVLVGLGGADTFAFTTALGAGNVDQIADFQTGVDKIQLAGQAGEPFAALATGALAADSFVVGAAAADANDYIIYNNATGALLYDADGNGAGAAVQFATLAPGLGLTAADFVVAGAANHAPSITSGATSSVAENSPTSTIVYQATATDADGDRVTWSLGGTDAGYLTIDPVTGEVRLVNSADFETKNSYSFTVTASDSDTASSAKPVTLSISDVADTPTTPVINETSAPNDSTSAAQLIDRNIFTISTNPDLPNQALPSATIHGSISDNNDVDYYSITLQAGEQIVLDVDHTTNSLDSFIRLYDSAGNEIVFNDDKISSDPGSNPPFDHNTDSYLTYRVGTSGTYYFSVESFGDLNNDDTDDGPTVGESNGNYSLNVSIGPPASAAQIWDEDIDAVLSGATWNHAALTYGFPTAASQYPGNFKETTPATDFTPFTAAQQGATVQLLQLIADVTPLTFTQQNASPGNADIRYGMSTEADVAYAYYPTNGGPTSVGGTAWFNKTDFNNPVRGDYAWMGILHETGHTLGLKHPFEAPAVSFDHDSVAYSVMTYRSYPGQDLNGYTNEQWGYPQTLMILDIAALQRSYGANFNFNASDSVYTWNATTGEMSINGVGQGAPGNGIGGSANRVFMTIWDGGGNDTYDLSNYTTGTTINLRPGEWTTTSAIQLANLGGGHIAPGNVANALEYQGNPASLIENAIGGIGNDTLIANQAANHLTGNGGSDTFRWVDGGDAGTGALADTIMDFARGTDKIDFSSLDANPSTPAHDPFSFLGTGAFTDHAGEVRYDVTGGNAHVFVDLDGNGVADMEIVVNNVTTLAATDFNF